MTGPNGFHRLDLIGMQSLISGITGISEAQPTGPDLGFSPAFDAIAEASALLSRNQREWHPWEDSDLTRINAAFAASHGEVVRDGV